MHRLALVVGLMLSSVCAYAADQPSYGPAADWVKPSEAPKLGSADTTTPTRTLIQNMQTRFTEDARETFFENIYKIQTPQGLQAAGNIALPWKPDTDSLTIHALKILRGDQTIDLLAGGHAFTVLRRENNLEMAMLDGALTAAIQPEGLQVGDIIDFAFTLRRSDPVMQGRAEALFGNLVGTYADRSTVRAVWPKSKKMRWRQTDGLAPPKMITTQYGEELSIEMSDIQPVMGPKGAPARYFEIGELEGSEFRSWADISALMAPLYEKAAVIGPASPLKAEAEKIKAAVTDPKARAMAALKLVEDQVRYLFLGMNNGGYVPAGADETWSRRFGDCKGKTVVLLALLRELGIEAEPALASVAHGDGLDERLAILEIFDHVLVRAVIAGKVYWLDGTRVGDRNLDDLPYPVFHWLLPVQPSGATLVKVDVPLPDKPFSSTELEIDASAGLDVPATAHATTVFRGDTAIVANLQLARASKTDVDKYLKDYWKGQYDWIDISKVDAAYDSTTGEERVSMEGSGKMEWKTYSERPERQYQADGSALGWKAEFDRDPGPNDKAPFAVVYPYFVQYSETIRLPDNGVGFTVAGADAQKIVAAREFKRTTRIENGVFKMVASTKSLAGEFPFADSANAKTELRALWDVTVDVIAPKGNLPAGGNSDSRRDDKLKAAEVFIQRAAQSAAAGQYENAITDYSQAIAANPGNAHAFLWRASCYYKINNMDKALEDLTHALSLDPNIPGGYRFLSELLVTQDKPEEALADIDRVLATEPDNIDMHGLRAKALTLLGRKDDAERELALMLPSPPTVAAYLRRAAIRDPSQIEQTFHDVDQALKLDPTSLDALEFKVKLYEDDDDLPDALLTLDRAVGIKPDDTDLLRRRATMRAENHQYDLAIEDLDRVIATTKNAADDLRDRCRYKALSGKNYGGALADCEAALKIDPANDEAKEARGFVYLRFGRFDAAIADYGDVLERRPRSASALFGRGLAKFKNGMAIGGQTDLATARAINPNIDKLFTSYSNTQTASKSGTEDFDSERKFPASADAFILRGDQRVASLRFGFAVADYTRAIALDGNSSQAYAKRGAAYLAEGGDIQAGADFEKALALDPKEVVALRGQGMIAFRKNDIQTSVAALTRALEIKPDYTEARTARIFALARDHQYDAALKDEDLLIEQHPDNPEFLNNRCWFGAIEGSHLDRALADCDASLKITEKANARDSRGFVNLRLGRLDDAINDYNAALAEKPNLAPSLFGRGIAKLRKGDIDSGTADLVAARAANPKIEAQFADYGVKP